MCNLCGSLISSGRCPIFTSIDGRWMCVLVRLNTWPFLTSFFCTIYLRILFCSDDKTLYANSALGVELASSSSVELESSDSNIFITFFFVGLEWMATFFGATFGGDGEASLNDNWPWLYSRKVVIKLFEVSIVNLEDFILCCPFVICYVFIKQCLPSYCYHHLLLAHFVWWLPSHVIVK